MTDKNALPGEKQQGRVGFVFPGKGGVSPLFWAGVGKTLVPSPRPAPGGDPRPPVPSGAFLPAGALVAATALFSWFIGLSSRYSLVYGSLASVIILLVWLYLCGNILILGNVFNCVWYRKKKVRALRQSRERRN